MKLKDTGLTARRSYGMFSGYGIFSSRRCGKDNGKFPPNIYASQNDGLHLHGFNDNDYWTKCMQYDFKYHRCP